MAYNHGREDRKWRIWKEAEEKLLRECGVDEATIEQIRIADRADFNSNRRFYRWTNDVGREVAERTYERHCFFTEQLIAAGVDPRTAEADACRIEHIISDESFSRLKEAAAMKELVRRQIQTVFALLSKKAQPPNSPRLAAGAKIVTM